MFKPQQLSIPFDWAFLDPHGPLSLFIGAVHAWATVASSRIINISGSGTMCESEQA